MLNIILAESSLEVIPQTIRNHPSVLADEKRRGKPSYEILLDKSFHYGAMHPLENKEKRGRPDIVHVCLLSVTSTPLYLSGEVSLYIHTINDNIIYVKEGTRLPKHYLRFRGLFEKLLSGKGGNELLSVRQGKLSELVAEIKSKATIGLSVKGKEVELSELAKHFLTQERATFVVGGFPHGEFTRETLDVFDEVYKIHPRPLEAHVVLARLLYELEKQSNQI